MGGGNKNLPNYPSHMINMAAMPIYSKIFFFKKIFSRTHEPMALKLGICHWILGFFQDLQTVLNLAFCISRSS